MSGPSLVVGRAVVSSPLAQSAPTVQVRNGSYYGLHNQEYDQDFFLGMPYAQPPVNDLRFRVPQSLNTTWEGSRNATEYSRQCIGYGSDNWVLGNYISEDCLTINVIRPAGTAAGDNLPVAFWIHGGGLVMGGGSDPRYNLSFIVDQSVKMEEPIVAVSINYRLHAWGFLYGSEIAEEGGSNIGFRDQRLALHWVQENIAAFGGDPSKVTIWGESAGGFSVGSQLIAYGGRDDGLIKGAVLESGWPVFPSQRGGATVEQREPYYQAVVNQTGCSDASDTLSCLREVPTADLSAVFNSSLPGPAPAWGNVADGDFFEQAPTKLIQEGKFVPVPVLTGQNHDEGTAFGRQGINTTDQFLAMLTSTGISADTAADIAELYPDIPELGVPNSLVGRPEGDLALLGAQWKRVAAYTGDSAMHAPRRLGVQKFAEKGVPVWSYNFEVYVNGIPPAVGATHFQEVVFVFYNLQADGYTNAVSVNPFTGKGEAFPKLANLMSRMWVSFFNHQDPNYNKVTCLKWPKYSLENPQNLMFDVNATQLAYVEPDTYRQEGISYLLENIF
ncbi:Alpha/Beta hydrolase protein [Emericellopsis atlantica]|uniref:Carboxylic ester hydrolase n=1 Tax=Emericellopsis atlantica TaxID=2614577 RepID=A0A9P7ZHE8_9HYPO|nr:Alpha/Beta hydrolase protein [Emericellopsis atlantica]KAG9251981.1 Alpha/Beta hydrolase protein [Emericellopsis atlantica]